MDEMEVDDTCEPSTHAKKSEWIESNLTLFAKVTSKLRFKSMPNLFHWTGWLGFNIKQIFFNVNSNYEKLKTYNNQLTSTPTPISKSRIVFFFFS